MENTIYAFIIKKTGKILNSSNLHKYKEESNIPSLVAYLPNKTLYTKLSYAKRGFSHLHISIKDHIGIGEFTFNKLVIDGEELRLYENELGIEKRKQNEKAELKRLCEYYENRLDKFKLL